jgi:ribonuclease HI
VLDSFQAEAVACVQGLQIAIDAGIAHVTVETDALLVKQAALSEE